MFTQKSQDTVICSLSEDDEHAAIAAGVFIILLYQTNAFWVSHSHTVSLFFNHRGVAMHREVVMRHEVVM